MFTHLQFHLTVIFLKIFLRNRQAIIFSLFFPLIFIGAFSFSGGEPDPISLGVTDKAESPLSTKFIELISTNQLFEVTEGEEQVLRKNLIDGDIKALIIIPQQFNDKSELDSLDVLLDASQVRQSDVIKSSIKSSLISIERDLRNIKPMFTLNINDVKARSQRYIDFLLPGLLAFMLMNLSIAGSGFNIVEYRRRGILKRLFVTPIEPKDFIISIVLARMLIVITQLSVVLGMAIFALNINITGSYLSFYSTILLGTFIFLCIGFSLGSLAKTQEGIRPIVGLVTFPQVVLSGAFFPISSMPEIIHPIAYALPLSSVVTVLRDVANDGATLFTFNYSTLGIVIWIFLSFFIATRFFVWKEVAK